MTRIAAKLLSAVEVSADASNQHEFNATELWKALGYPEGRFSGSLDLVYVDDSSDTEDESCAFTLYNSREGRPRGREYRLYFTSTRLQGKAHSGDILVVLRADDAADLRALVVSRDAPIHAALSGILAREDVELSSRFREIGAAIASADLSHLLDLAEHARVPDAETFLSHADHALVAEVLSSGEVPDTETMARAAERIVRSLHGGQLEPDDYLNWCLEAETALFRLFEERIGQAKLDALQQGGRIPFAEATVLILSQLQSRRTRRGHSLQHHFASVLRDRTIAFSPQCETENGETPDFMFPGCEQYHDAAFPADRLRMVACKSTLRDRWRQPLNEAARIAEKYVLTLDDRLSASVLQNIAAANMLVFVPEAIIKESYSERTQATSLHTVADLVRLLEAVT